MPRVRIYDQKQYEESLEVLTRVGGTFQGVGYDEWYLHVSIPQYQALLEAKVVSADDSKREMPRGKSAKRKAKL